jgi:hypothetical protein
MNMQPSQPLERHSHPVQRARWQQQALMRYLREPADLDILLRAEGGTQQCLCRVQPRACLL